MKQELIDQFKHEVEQELHRIMDFWLSRMPDQHHGGFLGGLDFFGKPVPDAPKGIILNTRILWTFSTVAQQSQKHEHIEMAKRAYQYLLDHFLDRDFGGVVWTVDYQGKTQNSRKQIYAQAFFIYALSAYYQLTKEQQALDLAISLFDLLEEKATDPIHGGYLDAFDKKWKELDDMRLSEKDLNEKKILNTHLHLLEAYSSLAQVYPNSKVKQALNKLLQLFKEKFIRADFHLNMFFDEHWNIKSQLVSYGHDIETSWLLYEAAEEIATPTDLEETGELAIQMTKTFVAEGITTDGGVLNEFDRATGHLDTDYHWWPQIEAIVGLINAWQLSKDEQFLTQALKVWEFTKNNLFDLEHGEWHWSVNQDLKPDQSQVKAGFWKCPYHNGRGCLEILKRLQ